MAFLLCTCRISTQEGLVILSALLQMHEQFACLPTPSSACNLFGGLRDGCLPQQSNFDTQGVRQEIRLDLYDPGQF